MNEQAEDHVTVTIAGQLFAVPISRVQDVFLPGRLTRVPLAGPEIAGLVNLRGRIITMIDMRHRLGLGSLGSSEHRMAVGIEHRGESYGLLVDEIGEVLKLPGACREPSPVNLERSLAQASAGVHRLGDRLMLVLDVDDVLEPAPRAQAA